MSKGHTKKRHEHFFQELPRRKGARESGEMARPRSKGGGVTSRVQRVSGKKTDIEIARREGRLQAHEREKEGRRESRKGAAGDSPVY